MASVPRSAREVAHVARGIATRVKPGPSSATRSLPIRCVPDEVERLWDARRSEILDGVPAKSATLRRGVDQGEWGTSFAVGVELDSPLPGKGAQVMAGKAVRRLKNLAETREMPTTERNPAYRQDNEEARSGPLPAARGVQRRPSFARLSALVSGHFGGLHVRPGDWAFGIRAGRFAAQSGPGGGTKLDVRAVSGIARVNIGAWQPVLSVQSAGIPPEWVPPEEQALISGPQGVDGVRRIACVRLDSEGRVAEVGGAAQNGARWWLSLADAIAAVNLGYTFFVERPEGDRVAVELAVSARVASI